VTISGSAITGDELFELLDARPARLCLGEGLDDLGAAERAHLLSEALGQPRRHPRLSRVCVAEQLVDQVER
jgi:hypothetical protein